MNAAERGRTRRPWPAISLRGLHGRGESVRPTAASRKRKRGERAGGATRPDVVVFDPASIADRATFEQPQAAGMKHVFVNGVQVLKDGEHTGARPGRALWGPGKVK